ncbi:hypothetical protein B0H13DRAFT_1018503 [Mycena leptocephala]|nr:hypothetical protein B0H13DRAFT_1018503 [Mycena leptocephala]
MENPVFETTWNFAVLDVIKTAIALFLNGAYVLLVIFALYFLRRRRPAGYSVLFWAIAGIFVLAMTQIALQIATATLSLQSVYSSVHINETYYTAHLDSLQHLYLILGFLEEFLLVTNNTITESLLIYRCYVIWGTYHNKKKIVMLPLFLLLCTTVLGYATASRNVFLPLDSHMDSRIVAAFAIINNLLVTSLTVGRIWWTRRHLLNFGHTKFIQRYNTAMAMLMESSAIYFIFMCILVVALSVKPTGPDGEFIVAYVCYGFGGQVVNIIPALLVVQVSLGHNTNTDAVVAPKRSERV